MSKKSNVHDITTGGPLGPDPEHIWLTVLYRVHLDPDTIIDRVAVAVPAEHWENLGPDTAALRVDYARGVADQLVYELAEDEIDNSIFDARTHSSGELDDEYLDDLTEAAICAAITDRMPRAKVWAEDMTDEEVDGRMVEMLLGKVSEMLGH